MQHNTIQRSSIQSYCVLFSYEDYLIWYKTLPNTTHDTCFNVVLPYIKNHKQNCNVYDSIQVEFACAWTLPFVFDNIVFATLNVCIEKNVLNITR